MVQPDPAPPIQREERGERERKQQFGLLWFSCRRGWRRNYDERTHVGAGTVALARVR